MRSASKLIAAATTTAAAATAVAYITMAPRGAAAPGGSSGSQAPGTEVKLCVASDRVLHANREGEDHCAAGQTEIDLASTSDQQVCDLCDPLKDQPPAEPSTKDPALDAIERRVRALEYRPYFEVVNTVGQRVVTVSRDGMRWFNEGRPVITVAMTDVGGYFSVVSPQGAWSAGIGTSGDNAGVIFREGSATRVELGTRDGPFGLRFPGGDGLIAGIGESRTGTGAVVVGTRPGRMRGAMMVSGTRGMVTMLEQPGVGGVTLAESAIGGGLLAIDDWKGNSAVKMGHNGHRYGVVLAGPELGAPYIPRSGVTGSYFMGCASGERPACMPSVPDK